jgi:hypothetical protein
MPGMCEALSPRNLRDTEQLTEIGAGRTQYAPGC